MEHLRSYEISIWTLQDSFITVLKPSNLEFRGQIVDPIMSIKDDGDNRLSFKIPMYILNDLGEFEENPIWYNIINGTIIANLRKAKVIFNKNTSEEEIFEFVIINVKERHEGYKKYCEIECEGLAFNELGKQGYKIALEGYDEIEIKQKEYFDSKGDSTEEDSTKLVENYPQPTINYWADKVFEGTNWIYSIQMDWSMHDGITHQVYTTAADGKLDSDNYSFFTKQQRRNFNTKREEQGLRRRDRVYEDEYVSAWEEKNGILVPSSVAEEKEKYRPVNAKESNRYNLSQTIAEVFQVHCRYKYYYDDNYHIIGREAIFYNNFLKESQGVIDLTYKYNTEHLTRIMDSTDTISKMFVRPLIDGDMPTGQTTISDTDSNKSLEDYIFNFDYMLGVGTITQEQYDEIEPYCLKMRNFNKELLQISEELISYEQEKVKQEARKKTAEDALTSDQEAVDTNEGLARDIGNEDGTIPVDANNPQMLYLIPNEKGTRYYCNFKTQGIIKKTLKLYWDYDNLTQGLSNPVKKYRLIKDDSGNLIQATNIKKTDPNKNVVYATYNYNPNTYYTNIIQTFQNRMAQDNAIINDAKTILGDEEEKEDGSSKVGIYIKIKRLEARRDALIEKKQNAINAFERMMGPALREGQWQPEDEYAGYGEVHEEKIGYGKTKGLLSLKWDTELFDDEQDCFFHYGALYKKRYYPCIRVSNMMIDAVGKENFLKEAVFVYKNSSVGDDVITTEYMAINSKMKFGFLKNNNDEIIPVLMLLDAEHMSEEQLSLLQTTGYISRINLDEENESIIDDTKEKLYIFSPNDWIIAPNLTIMENEKLGFQAVYPRFIINSLRVKSPETDIKIKRGKVLLTIYEDYYILPRINCYTATLKPNVFIDSTAGSRFQTKFNFYYTLSTAALAVYLDAIEVLKENSFPKVSYEIDVMSVNKDFIYNSYKRLGQIAHINDYEFKFENTLGYISEISLDLDKPWQDKVVIKNYKTKFEDLFSTIVAQSEQMKKNSATIAIAASAFNADGTLTGKTIGTTAMRAISSQTQITELVTSPAVEYAKYETFIRSQLAQSWQEAGEVLSAAQSSVGDVNKLNIKNADILAMFKTNIGENLTPTLFKYGVFSDKTYNTRTKIKNGIEEETVSFKVGDVLQYGKQVNGKYIVDTYMATENSSQVDYKEDEDKKGTSFKGWSRTTDGRLAAITGASLNVDAAEGAIEIKAEKTLSLLCKGLIDISGNDVLINGNQTVQIGGPDVKIYSVSKKDNPNEIDTTKGVHIYSTVYGATNSTSAVDITGEGVTVGSAGKIDIEAAKGINIFSSDDSSTSAIRINREEGIYLGTNKPIILYSGNVPDKIDSGYPISGASVEISQKRILFGVSDSNTTAMELTPDYIVFGAGTTVRNSTTIKDIGSSANNPSIDTTGVYIDKGNIKLAVGNSSDRSYIHMNNSGIIAAKTNKISNGAFVQINDNGIIIGTAPAPNEESIYVTNIKNGSSTMTGYKGAKFQVYAPNFVVDADGHLFAYEANIAGAIRAFSLEVGNKESVMTYDGKNGLKIGNNNDDSYLKYNSEGLTVKGNINATSLNIEDRDADTWLAEGVKDIKDTAESKAKVFYSTPTPPYSLGDIWVQGSKGDIKYCNTARASGNFVETDWLLAGKYTDDTVASRAQAAANEKAKIFTGSTPPTEGMKDGDLFIANGDPNYPAGRTYRRSGDKWIAISAGVIRGTSLEVDTDNGTINIQGEKKVAIVSGGTLQIASNGILDIAGGAINIGSGGNFNISSTNLQVVSNPSDDGNYFYVGDKAAGSTPPPTKYIKFTKNGNLEVKGAIIATSLTIGEGEESKTATDFVNGSINDALELERGPNGSIGTIATRVTNLEAPYVYTPDDKLPSSSSVKQGDLMIPEATFKVGSVTYYQYSTYKYIGTRWVRISPGKISGTYFTVNPHTGKIDISAKSTITIASGKQLSLATSGLLEITGEKGVTIGTGSKITLSGAEFIVDSGNFKITKAGNVSVKGTIDATGGSIGTWTLGSNYIGSGASRAKSVVGISNPSSNDSAAFWAGADGSAVSTAKFIVTKGGALTATGANIEGTITATSGTIGGCSITNKKLIVPSANISGTLTIGQLPADVATTSDVTTITENTLKTTNVVAENLQVAAANITGTLTGKTISGGTINGTEISGVSIKLGDLSNGGIGSISMYADLGTKTIGIWDKTSLRLYNQNNNRTYLSITSGSISQTEDALTINSGYGINITSLNKDSGLIKIQGRTGVSILATYTSASGTTVKNDVTISGKDINLEGTVKPSQGVTHKQRVVFKVDSDTSYEYYTLTFTNGILTNVG